MFYVFDELHGGVGIGLTQQDLGQIQEEPISIIQVVQEDTGIQHSLVRSRTVQRAAGAYQAPHVVTEAALGYLLLDVGEERRIVKNLLGAVEV